MKTTMLLIPVLAALLSFSCTKEDVTLTESIVKDPTPKTLPATLNRQVMLQMVNKIRQTGCQCGDTYYYPVPALNWNTLLELAAYNHSADMYQKNYFSHTAPDGSKAGDRIAQAGYNWMAYGENIGTGYKSETEVVEGWKNSPSHCKNIMNRLYKEMGVARVGNYWTQNFASK